ncbi:hypothetical protein B0H11DRAFT_2079114 [Mycena galericulata]|nr:hypothetical protein B0H11DRAFT_2079114 [Mycena galericulata]
MPSTPKSTPRVNAKRASRSESGCYTCRVRRKKCDESPDLDGNCETCVRLHIQCLGYGSKRPEWLRKPQADAMRAKIEGFLESKQHSGSGKTDYGLCMLQAPDDHSNFEGVPTPSAPPDSIFPPEQTWMTYADSYASSLDFHSYQESFTPTKPMGGGFDNDTFHIYQENFIPPQPRVVYL